MERFSDPMFRGKAGEHEDKTADERTRGMFANTIPSAVSRSVDSIRHGCSA